jgi:hypothetical protein
VIKRVNAGEQLGMHGAARERLEGGGANKLGRRTSEYYVNNCTVLREQAGQSGRFITSDATCDAKEDSSVV